MMDSDWEKIDISNVDYGMLRKMMSNEDYERLVTHKP